MASRNLYDDLVGVDEELDSSSGCDMSFENAAQSPTAPPMGPRKLLFEEDDEEDGEEERQQLQVRTPEKLRSFSPPYKRVKALRLFDSPLTPKTILEKSSAATMAGGCMTPVPNRSGKPRAVASAYAGRAANVNPFTPTGMLLNKKRTRSVRSLLTSPTTLNFDLDSSLSDVEQEQPTKRVALQESNISRYHKEFLELQLIGRGQFGSVYKCINRLDGCVYAIKKSTRPVAGSVFEKTALNEVYAHAVLGKHQNVVRYYSAWAEDNHMIIQNEYCDGGSLADVIEREPLNIAELRRLLLHVAEGLRYIHSEGLVHLDIKPGNIFISRERKATRMAMTGYDSADDGFEDLDEAVRGEEETTYKIGDLGHVTSLSNPQVEEGDCRYLPSEILQEDYSHLTKADIFSLGLTALESAGAGPLPKNGDRWHLLRNGELPDVPLVLPRDLLDLLRAMIDPKPSARPSAVQVLQNRALSPSGNKTRAQLRRELNAEKLKNEILSKQLMEAAKCIKTMAPEGKQKLRTSTGTRLVGKTVNRSASTTTF